MTREELTRSIQKYLISYTGSIQSDASRNLLSSSVLAEGFVAWMLNTLHPGWNLVNTNQGVSNFPAIDLIDENQKIAVQVSRSNTPKKVRHTLEEYDTAAIPNKEKYKLYIVSITMDKPTKTMLECADAYPGEVYVWSFDNLFEKITQITDLATLEAIHDGVKKEIAISPVEAPPFSLSPSSRVGDGFVGRKGQLLEMQTKLDGGMKPVVLNGLGGIGKTELAIHFGHGYRANCKGHVFFTTFTGSFRETLISMYNSLRDKPEIEKPAPEQMLNTVMSTLRGCGKSDILIVDNVDTDQGCLGDLMDEVYDLLEEMEIRLILTTRFDWDGATNVDILEKEELYRIFYKYSPNLAQADMDSLITAVNSHTLTIDLMARMLNGHGIRPITAQMLLEAFASNTVREEKYRKIAAHYKQSPKQVHIYEHLSAVFNVANLSTEAENVLRCATLLPVGGMDSVMFADSIPEEWEDALVELSEHGWLTAENGLLTIHPVIRLVCRTDLEPTDEKCDNFLKGLVEQFDQTEYDPSKLAQFADVFAMAADYLEDAQGNYLTISMRFYLDLAQYYTARKLFEKHLSTSENKYCDQTTLCALYTNLGSIYAGFNDLTKAIDYHTRALDCYRDGSLDQPFTLATLYNNLAATLRAHGDYQDALSFYLKAIEILENVHHENPSKLASVYNNVGICYGYLNQYKKALKYQMKALNIREKILPKNHPDLARTYDSIGSTACSQGRYQKALEYKLKALDIRKKTLPENHNDLAISYNNVGSMYIHLKKHAEALEFLKKSLALHENALPQNIPHISTTLNNIGSIYLETDRPEKALPYFQRSLDMMLDIFPNDHPEIRITMLAILHCKSRIRIRQAFSNADSNFSTPPINK